MVTPNFKVPGIFRREAEKQIVDGAFPDWNHAIPQCGICGKGVAFRGRVEEVRRTGPGCSEVTWYYHSQCWKWIQEMAKLEVRLPMRVSMGEAVGPAKEVFDVLAS